MDRFKNKIRGFIKFMAKKKFNQLDWQVESGIDFVEITTIENFNKLIEVFDAYQNSDYSKQILEVIGGIFKNSNPDAIINIYLEFIKDGKIREFLGFVLNISDLSKMFEYVNIFLNLKLDDIGIKMSTEFNSEINKVNSTFNDERLNLSNQISSLNSELAIQKENNNKLLTEFNAMIEVLGQYNKLKQDNDKLVKLYNASTEKLKEFENFKAMMRQLLLNK